MSIKITKVSCNLNTKEIKVETFDCVYSSRRFGVETFESLDKRKMNRSDTYIYSYEIDFINSHGDGINYWCFYKNIHDDATAIDRFKSDLQIKLLEKQKRLQEESDKLSKSINMLNGNPHAHFDLDLSLIKHLDKQEWKLLIRTISFGLGKRRCWKTIMKNILDIPTFKQIPEKQIYMLFSLIKSIDDAGGSWKFILMDKNITVASLISSLGTNHIRFHYERCPRYKSLPKLKEPLY